MSSAKRGKVTAIIGAQWGDEGKGKLVDLMSGKYDIIFRYQGGHNAGHTVVVDSTKYVFHIIPSGILHDDKICGLGNGVVFYPQAALDELQFLSDNGINVRDRLLLSTKSHVIMPYHMAIEAAQEAEKAKTGSHIGTTLRGIGPAYTDKTGRVGIRAGDLLHEDIFKRKVREYTAEKNILLMRIYGSEPLNADEIISSYMKAVEKLQQYGVAIIDTEKFLNSQIDNGRSVLLEGAQGVHLDVDFGTYPYVTSSSTGAAGAAVGSGISPNKITGIYGVVKAYTTRVGSGPFPTELKDSIGEKMQINGNEVGASTGRKRRCGWYDAEVVGYSDMLNNFDALWVTKMDVLDEFPEIKVCVGYKINEEKTSDFPFDPEYLGRVEPVYETLPGWRGSTRGTTEFKRLPQNAQNYIKFIERISGKRMSIISTGPERGQTIIRDVYNLFA